MLDIKDLHDISDDKDIISKDIAYYNVSFIFINEYI